MYYIDALYMLYMLCMRIYIYMCNMRARIQYICTYRNMECFEGLIINLTF